MQSILFLKGKLFWVPLHYMRTAERNQRLVCEKSVSYTNKVNFLSNRAFEVMWWSHPALPAIYRNPVNKILCRPNFFIYLILFYKMCYCVISLKWSPLTNQNPALYSIALFYKLKYCVCIASDALISELLIAILLGIFPGMRFVSWARLSETQYKYYKIK